jgi:hypothetical protein
LRVVPMIATHSREVLLGVPGADGRAASGNRVLRVR